MTTGLNPDLAVVKTANGPGIYLAPVGTPPPTATGEIAAPWVPLGFLADTGPKLLHSSKSEKFKPWQSKAAIRVVDTDRELSVELILVEHSKENYALYFAQPTPAGSSAAFTLDIRTDTAAPMYAVLLDIKDGKRIERVYFGRATLGDAKDMEELDGGVIGFPVTLTALDYNGLLAQVLVGQVA